jgi:hypothetical protein
VVVVSIRAGKATSLRRVVAEIAERRVVHVGEVVGVPVDVPQLDGAVQ